MAGQFLRMVAVAGWVWYSGDGAASLAGVIELQRRFRVPPRGSTPLMLCGC